MALELQNEDSLFTFWTFDQKNHSPHGHELRHFPEKTCLGTGSGKAA
jgi:hypothetical protein